MKIRIDPIKAYDFITYRAQLNENLAETWKIKDSSDFLMTYVNLCIILDSLKILSSKSNINYRLLYWNFLKIKKFIKFT